MGSNRESYFRFISLELLCYVVCQQTGASIPTTSGSASGGCGGGWAVTSKLCADQSLLVYRNI